MMANRMKTDIVPWKNPAEFIKVYEYAYSDDLAKNRWAVEQMAVWETRCWPSLPNAVEATLLFVRSKIQDKLYEANKSLCDAQEVEMMYASSVIRFVNLLVENDQNSKYKKRIADLAADRNIPPWIVDIRHDSTHGFIPTLPVLRMAYETIMAYLEEIFWLPESSRVSSIKKTLDETPILALLQKYRLRQYGVIMTNGNKKRIRTSARNKVLGKIDNVLKSRESRKKIINILARDLVTDDDVNSMAGDDIYLMDPNKLSACYLPEILQMFYDPIIHLLHKHNLISTFLELLLLNQEQRKLKVVQKFVDLLVLYILDLTKAGKAVKNPESAEPFIQKGANINMYRLLYSCVQGCSYSARIIFERLVKDMKLSPWSTELSMIMNIRMGNTIDKEPERGRNQRKKRKFEITFTAEDLEEDLNEEMEKKTCIKSKKDPWFFAPLSTNWASVPVGHVFHPVDVSKKEELNNESETISSEDSENMYAYVFEESKPVEKPQPTNFIFSKIPEPSGVIYQRKAEEIEC